MSRKALVAAGIVLLVLLCFGAIGVYVIAKRKTAQTPEQLFAKGAAKFNNADYGAALTYFAAALEKQPTNAAYSREAARSASYAGRAADSQIFAQRAWDSGIKDPELLRLILTGYDRTDLSNSMPAGLMLVDQLPDPIVASELRGDVYSYFRQHDSALKAWGQSLARYPTNAPLVFRVAKTHLQAREPEKAKGILQEYQSKGGLDEEGYSFLASLHALEEDYPATFAVFESAKRAGFYRDRLALEHSLVYLVNHRPEEARAILATLQKPSTKDGSAIVRSHARVFLGYTLLLKGDKEAIKQLARLVEDEVPAGPGKEAEKLFFEGLLQTLEDKPEALDSYGRARKLFSSQPAIELLYAVENLRVKNYGVAVDALKDIRGIMERWPPLNFELAVAYHGNRQDRLALQTLSKLHKRKMVSKESLELFRDIAFQNNLRNASARAQDALEKAFPDDADVQLFRGLGAMQQGSYGKAGEIFQDMERKYPQDVRFKLGPIQVLLAEGRYREAVIACGTNTAPAESVSALLAIAQAKLQLWNEAETSFKKAMTIEQPAMLHAEYGKLLASQGRLSDAEAQFQRAIAKTPDLVDAHVGLALVSVENRKLEDARRNALSALTLNAEIPICYYVVALADAQAGDARKAIENCQAALKKDPKLFKAALLQATLKSVLGQNDDAEKEFIPLFQKEPNDPFIRQQLAVIYRRKGEYKKALELIEPVAKAKAENQQLQMFRLELLALAGQPRQAESLLNGLKSSLGPVKFDMASSWLADVEGDFNRAVALIESRLADRAAAIQWATIHLKNKKEPASWLPLIKHQLTVDEWTQLAFLAERHDLWAASTFCYEQALKLDPGNPVLLNNWAWGAMNLKEFDRDRVLDAIRRSYAALPKNPTVLDTYAEGLLRTGHYRECVDVLNANLAVTRRTPQLLLLLARAYESNNDLENSLRTYRQVLDLQTRTKDWELRTGREALNQQIQQLELKVN